MPAFALPTACAFGCRAPRKSSPRIEAEDQITGRDGLRLLRTSMQRQRGQKWFQLPGQRVRSQSMVSTNAAKPVDELVRQSSRPRCQCCVPAVAHVSRQNDLQLRCPLRSPPPLLATTLKPRCTIPTRRSQSTWITAKHVVTPPPVAPKSPWLVPVACICYDLRRSAEPSQMPDALALSLGIAVGTSSIENPPVLNLL